MVNTVPESAPDFHQFIELNKSFTPAEAIQKLCDYHHASVENVLTAFINLQGITEGTVTFKNSVNSGYPCICMEIYDTQGKRNTQLINMHNGKPMMRCG